MHCRTCQPVSLQTREEVAAVSSRWVYLAAVILLWWRSQISRSSVIPLSGAMEWSR